MTATAKTWEDGKPFEKEWRELKGKGEGGFKYGTVCYHGKRGGWESHSHQHDIEQSAIAPKVRRLTVDSGLLTLSPKPPPPRDYVLDGLLVASKSVILAGLGGVSKTMMLIHLAVCVALGLPFAGRKVAEGCVILLLAEEDGEEIQRRFGAVAKAMRLTPEQIAQVQERIRAVGMVGGDMRLTRIMSGALEATGFSDDIIGMSKELAEATGLPVRLIGLDHAAMIHGGDFNRREDVAQTMREVNHVALESGAAVLVLAHSPKASIQAEKVSAADIAGNLGWVDMARGAIVLHAMTDEAGKKLGIAPEQRPRYVFATGVKNNYGPSGEVIQFERVPMPEWGVSTLQHVDLEPMPKAPAGSDTKLRQRILELIRSNPTLTKTQIDQRWAGKDGPLKASKGVVVAELESMTAEGVIDFRPPTEEERTARGIKGPTKGIFVITDQNMTLSPPASPPK